MLRYGMANEESFQSLSEESTIDLSANRKRKGKAAVENPRTLKSRRWCDAEVDRLIELLEERPCLWDVFCKDYHAREKRERAYEDIGNELEMDVSDIKAKITPLYSRSFVRHFLGKPIWRAFVLKRILGRFWTQTSRAHVLNPTCCIRLATSSNNVGFNNVG